ncbi:translation initiation factor eIF2B subunit alpha-like [Oscarella lobularis]|uniref:translation initiation factor eIF2B subunit alpha-like n=1 Tax=Oscarella lobularis TaxID=121494 RepID=UPI003313B4F6
MATTQKLQQEDLVPFFERLMKNDPEMSTAIAAIHTLIEFLKGNTAETVSELTTDLKEAGHQLQTSDQSVVSVESGCELFLRFITLTALDKQDFSECKRLLIERGQLYLQRAAQARAKITRLGMPFIHDGATILTHSRSRVVLNMLQEAAKANKRFTIFVTESQPDKSGYIMEKSLEEAGVPTFVILDAAVGYIMERVDLVIFGAEGVVESGGIINKIGTYQIAVVAKAANKPVYAVAESFKFVRLFPLNQQEAPNKCKEGDSNGSDMSRHFSVDYTPPSYINLLVTDLGVLTPSAVSDELIKLYC